MTPRFTGKARVASFLAAGIIGFGGVAAAGPKVVEQFTEQAATETDEIEAPIDLETESPDAPETGEEQVSTAAEETGNEEVSAEVEEKQAEEGEEEEEVITEAGDDTDTDPALDPDPETAFNEAECADGNHGKTVSSVARTEGRTSQDVVDAAHSSCGKDKKDDTDGETDADDEDDGDDLEDDANEVDEDEVDEDEASDDEVESTKDKVESDKGKGKSGADSKSNGGGEKRDSKSNGNGGGKSRGK